MAKILLTCHQFFPRYFTGTETLVLEVADELVARGHTVKILTTEPLVSGDVHPPQPTMIQDFYNGHEIFRLIIPLSGVPKIRIQEEVYNSSLSELYREVINQFEPDVCHVFHLWRLTSSLIDFLHQKGIKIFLTSTDYWSICPTYQLLRYNDELCECPEPKKCFSCLTYEYVRHRIKIPLVFKIPLKFPGLCSFLNKESAFMQAKLGQRIELHRRVIKSIDGIFYSNTFMQNIFHKNGIFSNNEYIQEFPLPKRAEKVSTISSIQKEGPLRVGFIGTLSRAKGTHVLIEACKIIKDIPNISLNIWGKINSQCEYCYTLQQNAKEVEWINFCGTFPQENFDIVLEELDVIVIPSLWYENTPLTALTALAGKRAVIASNLGGLSSTIENGVNGFLFEAGDANSLAKILVNLSQNKDKLVQMANKIDSPLKIEEYTDQLLKCYSI